MRPCVITVQQEKPSAMVGGRANTFALVAPRLLDFGPKVTHVGENGLAPVTKIATNLALPVQIWLSPKVCCRQRKVAYREHPQSTCS
jgi:3-hydroxyisobutyrate dehydrogenase-like beta-hydroxyacid dehydrogenase